MTVPAWAVGLPRWGVVLECLAHGLAAVMGMGSPSGSGVAFWVWGGEDSGNGSGSAGARLPDFVGAVESGACDDMSGHGVECVGEGELVGQVELVVQGEELEDVGVWSV